MKSDRKAIGTILFLFVQTICYITFLAFDFSNSFIDLSNKVKFFMIIVCFCYVLFLKNSTGKSILNFLRPALLFTVISDLNLLLLDHYLYGVLSFIVVQQLYGLRIDAANQEGGREKAGRLLRVFLVRISLQAVLSGLIYMILFLLKVEWNVLLIASVFYFISIVTNVIRAVLSALNHKHRGNSLFAIGMFLFLLCDINVGLFNLADFIIIPDHIYHSFFVFTSILMWAFYAPSQVLISLSGSMIRQNQQK